MNCINRAELRFWQSGKDIKLAGFEWRNNKPLALLSHANGFCAATWALVVHHLLPHYHVIAFDTRGHGQSSTPPAPEAYQWKYLVDDLLGLTEQILSVKGEQQVALAVGSSLGGVITAAAAAAKPELFQRVVMLDSPIVPNAATTSRLGLEMPNATMNPGESISDIARRRRAVWDSREVARNKWRGKPMFAGWDNQAFELYLKYGFKDCSDGTVELACPPEVEAAIFDQTGSINIFDRASLIRCPIQVVHAARGPFPEVLYQELARLCPQGEFVSIDGGHLLPMEVPELTAKLLINTN